MFSKLQNKYREMCGGDTLGLTWKELAFFQYLGEVDVSIGKLEDAFMDSMSPSARPPGSYGVMQDATYELYAELKKRAGEDSG